MQLDNAILLLYLFFGVCVLDLQESPGGEGKILSIKISNHQFYKLLPVKLDQEQLDELELEAKIQGLFVLPPHPPTTKTTHTHQIRTSVVLV